MSVNVEFAADGRQGVVAGGTYVWDAAKRLGLRLPAECGGRGECDTCAVIVREGMVLLSELTNAERTRLSPERLAAGGRLPGPTKNLSGWRRANGSRVKRRSSAAARSSLTPCL